MTPFASHIMTMLQTRLLHHGSDEATKMAMRSELQTIERKLKELLWKTVLDDENASVLLYGYPGVGKTLVRYASVLGLSDIARDRSSKEHCAH